MLIKLIVEDRDDYEENHSQMTFMFRTEGICKNESYKQFIQKLLKTAFDVNQFTSYNELTDGLEEIFGFSDVENKKQNKWQPFVITDENEINRLSYHLALSFLEDTVKNMDAVITTVILDLWKIRSYFPVEPTPPKPVRTGPIKTVAITFPCGVGGSGSGTFCIPNDADILTISLPGGGGGTCAVNA